MWSRGWGRKEAAAPRGPGVAAPDRGSGGCEAGAERGGRCVWRGWWGCRCAGGGGGVEGRGVKFKARPGPVPAEGRGAREGIRVWPGCGDRPESFKGESGYLEGAQGDWS